MGLISMKQCKQCGRKGLFLTLCEDGLCSACHQKAQEEAAEAERLQQIEEENLRKEKEERELQNAISKYNELVGYYTAHEISLEKCSLDELKQAIIAGQKFCDFLAEATSTPRFDEAFAQDGYVGLSSVYNRTFGSFDLREDSSICLDSITEKVLKNCRNYQELLTKSESFEELLASIPSGDFPAEHKGLRAPTTKPLAMKESNITKRTNASKVNSFFALDIETTGLSLVTSEIIQISVIRFANFQPVEAITSFVHPKNGLNPSAQRVNHITEEDVAEAPEIEQILPVFDAYLSEELPIVGHNLSFDYNFLYANGSQAMYDHFINGRKMFDTLSLSKREYSWYPKHNLEYLCRKHLGIIRSTAHNALSDALTAGLLFAAICESRITG